MNGAYLILKLAQSEMLGLDWDFARDRTVVFNSN